MKFESMLTEDEFREFTRVHPPRYQWIADLIAVVTTLWLLWDPICLDLLSQNPRWGRDAISVGILVSVGLGYLYLKKRRFNQSLAAANSALDHFILDDEGVRWHSPRGATGLVPWNRFYRWKEGKKVIVLENSTTDFMVLPLRGLSEIEREPIRQFLRSRIHGLEGTDQTAEKRKRPRIAS